MIHEHIAARHFEPMGTLFICLVAFLSLVACGRSELAQRPPQTIEQPSFATDLSTIGALASVSVSDLAQMLNEKAAMNFSASGHGPDVCAYIGWRPFGRNVCAGTRYEFHADRSGPIQVEAAENNQLRVSIPIAFHGQGGFRGDGARLLALDRKNFNGTIIAHALLGADLDSDWCPRLTGSVTYNWTSNPRIEVVSRAWVDVKGQVQDAIDKKLPDLVAAATSAIDCARVKKEVAKVYGSRTFPIEVPSIGKAHINLLPQDIGFSGLRVERDALKVAATLTAKVDVAAQPLVPELLPLPPLKRIALTTPRMTIAVPIRAPFETLAKALNSSLGGKTFEQNTERGRVSVTLHTIELYPSNGKLVIGIDMTADLPSSILDTKGSIYILGTPTMQSGTIVALSDASYAETLDNGFWSTASVVFEGQIRQAIQEASAYDLGPEIVKAKDTLATKLADPASTPGIKVSLANVDMRVGRIVVADKEFAIEGLFGVDANVAITP